VPYRPGTVQPEARWVRAAPARHGPTFSSTVCTAESNVTVKERNIYKILVQKMTDV